MKEWQKNITIFELNNDGRIALETEFKYLILILLKLILLKC